MTRGIYNSAIDQIIEFYKCYVNTLIDGAVKLKNAGLVFIAVSDVKSL